MRTQFTDLKECLVIDQFMKHVNGGFKDQWPPVGKSSDTPKEVKNARREELPTGNREARGYGAGYVYNYVAIPSTMSLSSELMTKLRECKCAGTPCYVYCLKQPFTVEEEASLQALC